MLKFAVLSAFFPPSPLQLVRRNQELALLYEKIKIQQSALQRGQAQYRNRLDEIRALKIKASRTWQGRDVRCRGCLASGCLILFGCGAGLLLPWCTGPGLRPEGHRAAPPLPLPLLLNPPPSLACRLPP